jgi:hypothetical protein
MGSAIWAPSTGGLAVPPEVWGPRQAPRAPRWSTSRSAVQVSEDTGPFIYSDWPRTSGVMRPSFHAERALGPSGHKRARGPSQARRWERTVCKSDQPSATWAMTWLHRPPAAPRTSDAGGRRRPIVKQIFSPQISRTGPMCLDFSDEFRPSFGQTLTDRHFNPVSEGFVRRERTARAWHAQCAAQRLTSMIEGCCSRRQGRGGRRPRARITPLQGGAECAPSDRPAPKTTLPNSSVERGRPCFHGAEIFDRKRKPRLADPSPAARGAVCGTGGGFVGF